MDNGQSSLYGASYDKSQQFRQQQQQRSFPQQNNNSDQQLHHHHRPLPPPQQQQQQGQQQQQQGGHQHSHQHSHSHSHSHQVHPQHHHHSRPQQQQEFNNNGQSSNGGGQNGGGGGYGGFEYGGRFSGGIAGPAPVGPPTPVIPRVPLAERDVYMLSLASQDSPSYYDPTDSSSSETDEPIGTLITNRGNKLLSSARNVRRGRLGSYPHEEIGFDSPSSQKKRKLESSSTSSTGGFAIAPNLHLTKRKSSCSPAVAMLPPAAQSPLDLLLATSTQHTLGPKNQIFKILGMSSIGLIEQEGNLIGNLRRVCAGLRGEGFEFRLEGDEEIKLKREQERLAEEAMEDERVAKLEEMAANEERIRLETEANIQIELQRKLELERIEREITENALETIRIAEEQKILALEAEARAVEEEMARMKAVEDQIKLAKEEEERKKNAMVTELEEGEVAEVLPTTTELPINRPIVNGISEDIKDPTLLASLSSLPPLTDLLPNTNGDTTMMEVNEKEEQVEVVVEEEEEEEYDEPTQRRSGRILNPRSNEISQEPSHHESSISDSEHHQQQASNLTRPTSPSPPIPTKPKRIVVETLPEYATRLVDPEIFVRSLFVSEESVGIPISIQGGPAGSLEVDMLSPNEQEVMVHDCLTDLHRFLADSLEYRARLEEIRDGVLGIERRRKGMWKVVRMVAADWIEEENF